jgi:ATP-dependent RNA helicase SUPV3L1/SUV3
MLQWRNSKLDFSSLGALQVSLSLTPEREGLTRAPIAEDLKVLDHASRDGEVRDIAHGAAAVERLWDACQIPDYRKLAPAAHAELVTTVFGFLMRKGRIPDAWFAAQIAQADRTDGDIDTLSGRIAQIRTWSFVANRPDWLRDPDHWQGISRELENKLSDALHERLTERFVDRRTSVLMRRLRENAMLNTEIGKTGEVIVEGHVIGRLDGFTFVPDAAEAGSEAKALQATALKALAGEIEARAAKLAAAPDEQFVLTSDGTLRWTGEAVAKLVAADDVREPRLRVIADDRLTGAPREAVQARLELWLKTHIEKLLGPLFELSKAEDVTGIARGIAFQLAEALGVLERSKIAAEMKDLDQASRATLRKYGVRFGAYHIYVPSLLKPAARALASLLWAQKRDNVDMAALSNAQHLAGSGRTSFPVDKSLDRDAYRMLGYRQCGERAVRVDILERLADLIRPALAWRENSSGEKPAGAFDGRGFIVTQAMTSLTGSAGEDFASIMRALGYRMEKRPPLPPAPPQPAETPAADAAAEAAAEVTSEVAVNITELVQEAVTEAPPLEAVVEPAPSIEEPVAEAGPETPPVEVESLEAVEASEVSAAEASTAEAPATETPAAEEDAAATETVEAAVVAGSDPVLAADTAVAEPDLVEVWRPGGRSDDRPKHDRNRQRHGQRTGATPAAASGEAGEAAKGDRPDRGRRDRKPDFRRPRPDAAPAEAGAEAAQAREGRPNEGRPPRERERFQGKGRGDKGGKDKGYKGGREGREGGGDRAPRVFSSQAPRERVADPNSPFAKLAALKEQLTANRKD